MKAIEMKTKYIIGLVIILAIISLVSMFIANTTLA
jgi:hypothetical protein